MKTSLYSAYVLFTLLASFQVLAAGDQPQQCPLKSLIISSEVLNLAAEAEVACKTKIDEVYKQIAARRIQNACAENQTKLTTEQNCNVKCVPLVKIGFEKGHEEFPIYEKTDCQAGHENYKVLVKMLAAQLEAMEKREEQMNKWFKDQCPDIQKPPVSSSSDGSFSPCLDIDWYKKWEKPKLDSLNEKISRAELVEMYRALEERKFADQKREDGKPENIAKVKEAEEKRIQLLAQKQINIQNRETQERERLAAESKAAADAAQKSAAAEIKTTDELRRKFETCHIGKQTLAGPQRKACRGALDSGNLEDAKTNCEMALGNLYTNCMN